MDAFGFPWIILETVGVGQTELDVIRQADTTVVALVPESGDSIQAMKAGLMEVADIFVVNKADRDGAHALMADIRFSVHLQYTSGAGAKDVDWETPVLAAQAANDVGVAELLDADRASPRRPRRRRARSRRGAGPGGGPSSKRSSSRSSRRRSWRACTPIPIWRARSPACPTGALDPYSAVTRILSSTLARPVVPQK